MRVLRCQPVSAVARRRCWIQFHPMFLPCLVLLLSTSSCCWMVRLCHAFPILDFPKLTKSHRVRWQHHLRSNSLRKPIITRFGRKPGIRMLDSKQSKQRPSLRMSLKTQQGAEEDIGEALIGEWRRNDETGVYEHLDQLERAIRLENPDSKLRFMELQETINCINHSKYSMLPNAIKHVIMPLVYAGVLYMGSSTRIARAFTKLFDIHFWVIVVASPIFFLSLKHLFQKSDPMPDQIKELLRRSPDYIKFSTVPLALNWEDPETGCSDYVLFLSEYWVSAVRGIALVPLLKLMVKRWSAGNLAPSFPIMSLWLASAQFLTRLGALASLYQYPQMMFKLMRPTQPQPIGFFTSSFQTLVRSMLYLAPLGLISDFSKILSTLPKECVYSLYGSISIYLIGLWKRMNDMSSKDPETIHRLDPPDRKTKFLYGLCYMILWRKQLFSVAAFCGRRLETFLQRLFSYSTSFYFTKVCLFCLVILVPLTGPLMHLKAFGKIFSIVYSNELPPLITDSDNLSESEELSSQMEWKFHISFRRKPKRLSEVTDDWLEDSVEKFLIGADQEAKLEKLRDEQLEREALEGRTIWDRVKDDLEEDPEAYARNPPSTWRARAMEKMGEIHEANYYAKRFEDPLGMAIYRGFGVGLGLGNITALENEPVNPSPRWLQLRAAASARKRYNVLRDAMVAREMLDKNLDPKEREQRKQERVEMFEKEIRYIGSRLAELVPSTSDPDLFDSDGILSKLSGNRPTTYQKVSDHEMLMLRDDPIDFDLSIMDRLYGASRTKSENRTRLQIDMSPSVVKKLNEINFVGGSDKDKNERIQDRNGKKDGDGDDDDWEPEIIFV